MTIVLHYLHTWKNYLLRSYFVVKMDNVATSYFPAQHKLNLKQAYCQDFLVKFNYILEYKPGQARLVTISLSQNVNLVTITMLECRLLDQIHDGLQWDTISKDISEQFLKWKTRKVGSTRSCYMLRVNISLRYHMKNCT